MSEVSLCGPPFERETQLPVEDALRISREVADAKRAATSSAGSQPGPPINGTLIPTMAAAEVMASDR